jgi:cell division protein FtsQ
VVGAGGEGLSASAVSSAAALPVGAPLASIDTGAAVARVEKLAQVSSATVTLRWPHGAVVTVKLRTPVALIPDGSSYREVDITGAVIRTVSSAPSGLPVIRVTGSAAVRAAAVPGALNALAALRKIDSSLADEVQGISASSAFSIMLDLDGGITVIWGGGDDALLKAEDLVALMRYKKASAYNVSAPNAPAVA